MVVFHFVFIYLVGADLIYIRELCAVLIIMAWVHVGDNGR